MKKQKTSIHPELQLAHRDIKEIFAMREINTSDFSIKVLGSEHKLPDVLKGKSSLNKEQIIKIKTELTKLKNRLKNLKKKEDLGEFYKESYLVHFVIIGRDRTLNSRKDTFLSERSSALTDEDFQFIKGRIDLFLLKLRIN